MLAAIRFLPVFCIVAFAFADAEADPVTRLNGGLPLITRQTFIDVDPGFTNQGANINGPSVIRVPDWIAAENRPDPAARYYLYFGDHDGAYIRMAWAEEVDGPYTLFGMHFLAEGLDRGVLDMGGDRKIPLANGLEIRGHISSPDVHVNEAEQHIEMYFHGPSYHNGVQIEQKTFVAFSDDGLDFNDGIVPVMLCFAYARVFDHGGSRYAIASRGALYEAPADPFTPPAGFDFSKNLWTLSGTDVNDNPFQADIDADPDGPGRIRHSAVRVDGDSLKVYHTRVGDSPERVLLSTIDLTVGGPALWDPTYPPLEVLRPERDWEGGRFPVAPSGAGAQVGVRQLRDPYVFEDADGSVYLFYSGAGEEAIGVIVSAGAKSSVPH